MNSFSCALCGGTFEKGWDDEEALAESRELYGEYKPEDLAVVCHDCFRRMTAAYPPEHFQEDQAAGIERRIVLP